MRSPFQVQQITAAETISVRHHVLWPDKPMDFCQLPEDQNAVHFGIKVKRELVCVASLFINKNEARLRKFATLPSYQNQGLGSELLQHIISDVKKRNIEKFWLDARETAVPFYRRFGLTVEGEPFLKHYLTYVKMVLRLS